MARAAEVLNRRYDRDFISELTQLMMEPHFEVVSDDWRKYIDDELKKVWLSLDQAMRLAIFITATRVVNASKTPVVR